MFSLSLIVGIVGLIVAGSLIAYAIVLTMRWLRNKIAEKLKKRETEKILVVDLKVLLREASQKCDNKISIGALDDYVNTGHTHVMVEVGYDGNIVGEVEVIKDKNDTIDKDVEELLNRTGQGMVIVEG